MFLILNKGIVMSKWSLNAKLILIISVLAAGSILISYFGIAGMSGLNEGQKAMLRKEVKADSVTFQMTDQQRLITIATRDIIIARDENVMKDLEAKGMAARKEMLKFLDEYRSLADEKGKVLADEYRKATDKWFIVTDEVIAVAKQNKDDEVRTLLDTKVFEARKVLVDLTDKINAETAKEVEEAIIQSEDSFNKSRNLILIISLFSIVSSLIISYVILNSLSKTIQYIITTLGDNTNLVSSAANQISAASQGLSDATTEQAASLEETSSSIAEMNSMVLKTSDNAGRSTELSNTSHSNANHGKKVVEEMIGAIDGISESNDTIRVQVEESNRQISDIVKVIAEIENKTKVINDIVFQTKLLSFNASVEAARAGEHGKGFAVVAEEVGNLAEMSGKAAKEISDLLDSSIRKVESIVEETKTKVERLMHTSKDRIQNGTKIAQQCGEVLESIVSNVSSVNTMVNEIAEACQEQSQGVQEITKAVSQLDQVTQQNAATSEETASAAEELAHQAIALKNVVQLLTDTIKGHNGEREQAVSSKPSHPETSVSKVIPFKPKKAAPKMKVSSNEGARRVVGASTSVPSPDDSRFENP
jgi:methyl-accepting chemotaxis protein